MKTEIQVVETEKVVQGCVIITDEDKYLVVKNDDGEFMLLNIDDCELFSYTFNDIEELTEQIVDDWGEKVLKIVQPDKLTLVEDHKPTKAPIF